MIQFLIGHPKRSSLLWHEHGITMVAVQGHITPLDSTFRCERFGERTDIERELTMISPGAMRDTLSLFVLSGGAGYLAVSLGAVPVA